MTELADLSSDAYLSKPIEDGTANEGIEEIESDDCASEKSDSSMSCSESWSTDDSIVFVQTSHKSTYDELTGTESPNAISLFNLSISPISSAEDLTRINDQSVCTASPNTPSAKYAVDWTKTYPTANDCDENEQISLDEIHAHINTPPLTHSKSNKRLNLETIFEDVFLETPKKQRFHSWRIETFQEVTNEERISSYVFEQQQSISEATNILCGDFDSKINL